MSESEKQLSLTVFLNLFIVDIRERGVNPGGYKKKSTTVVAPCHGFSKMLHDLCSMMAEMKERNFIFHSKTARHFSIESSLFFV